jgi:EAL domain-containing protein (putative c-di-GMP-specific phosphodiesterase class I)
MPDDFIGLAEEVGLMTRLGEWVLETACIQARMWQLEEQPVRVAVNLSASEFKRPDLVSVIRDILRRAGLSPALLELEVAESIVMHDAEYSQRVFRELADLGVMLGLGNFGTGFISLSLLHNLPIHTVKVDRSLIRQHLNDAGDKQILNAIFGLANALGMKAVAEGLENLDQLVLLHGYPCDRAQGFAIARPAPDSE